MKENNKPNTAENINDEELQNVTGGEGLGSYFCKDFKSQKECNEHFDCMWSKNNYCHQMLL
ncbi:MAG: bacteriocin, partial [Bacteroidales bacterium]|nr:bacteriocin [Bacteroidales bacterium]